MKAISLGVVAFALAVGANATVIDFNTGTNHTSVGAFYSGLGVTFSNTSWDDFACLGACTGLDGLHITDGPPATYQPLVGTPIIITFSTPVSFVSIFGLNVGENGARMDAYNSVVGGSLLGFSQDHSVLSGVGSDNNPLLSIAASGIRRVELYQPFHSAVEGLLFDKLTFTAAETSVPEPSTLSYAGLFAGALVLYRMRARFRRS